MRGHAGLDGFAHELDDPVCAAICERAERVKAHRIGGERRHPRARDLSFIERVRESAQGTRSEEVAGGLALAG